MGKPAVPVRRPQIRVGTPTTMTQLPLILQLTCNSALMAVIGCSITILSLGYSTFIQQLVGYEMLPSHNGTLLANIPRTETWDQLIVDGDVGPLRMSSTFHRISESD